MSEAAMPTEAELAALVGAFYAKIRADDRLGPLFNAAVDDWPEHLEKLAGFWSSVMLTSGRYKGNPVAAHAKHATAIRPEMFDHWLALWAETAREILAPGAADLIRLKAERIAESLKLALFFRIDPPTGRAAA
jgi:hemoglobin